MKESPKIINIYDLPIASNVCNQTLREVIKRPSYSLAHVIMDKGNISLYHNHLEMTEVYFIISGKGILYLDDKAITVETQDYIEISKRVGHKLKNIGSENLEHLVIAIPPFTPQDVHLLENRKSYNPKVLNREKERFAALDGAVVEELNSKEEREALGLSFALGTLTKERKGKIHHHNISEEIYYVISGEGKIHLDGFRGEIKKDTLIFIPKTIKHGLENTGDKDLEILCIANPPYQENDFILS